MDKEYVVGALNAPPVAVSAISLMGMPLNEWVYLLTILWLVLQSGYFVWSKVLKKGK